MTASAFRERTPDGREAVVVRRHSQVVALLLDSRVAIQPPSGEAARSWFPDTPMSRMLQRMGDRAVPEGGSHAEERDRRRDFIRSMLDRESVRGIRLDVQSMADALVDDLIRTPPPADLSQRYSNPLCAQVACALLAVPADDADRFRTWAAAKVSDDYRRAALTLRDMTRYVNGLIQRSKAAPGDDVVSHLLATTEGNAAEREACTSEIVHWIMSLGWQVPAAAIDTGMRLFLDHPAQRELLLSSQGSIDTATEEVLRLFDFIPSDMGGVDRFALEDMEIDGQLVRAGELIVLDVSSANRDPDVFEEPQHFDAGRTPNQHLTFGRGAYYCHFSRVARQEVAAAIDTALRRLPGLRLVDAAAPSAEEGLMVTWDG